MIGGIGPELVVAGTVLVLTPIGVYIVYPQAKPGAWPMKAVAISATIVLVLASFSAGRHAGYEHFGSGR